METVKIDDYPTDQQIAIKFCNSVENSGFERYGGGRIFKIKNRPDFETLLISLGFKHTSSRKRTKNIENEKEIVKVYTSCSEYPGVMIRLGSEEAIVFPEFNTKADIENLIQDVND